MAAEVIVCPVSDSPEFSPSEREQELNIGRRLAVEAELLLGMITKSQLIVLQSEIIEPFMAEASPVIEPLQIGVRLAEELQLHLFKLTGTEGEIARRDLVTEGFSDLTDAERNFLAGGSLYILEVHKNALCGLRTQIYGILRVLGYALECFEHQVELTDISEVMLAAARAGNFMLLDEVHHFLIGPAVTAVILQFNALLLAEILDQLVRPETLMALLAVHERIGEASQMSGCHPRLRVHQNCAVYAYIQLIVLNKFLPPCSLDIIFELNTQRAIIPRIGETSVNFGARVYKSAVLCHCDDLVHCLFHPDPSPFSSCPPALSGHKTLCPVRAA